MLVLPKFMIPRLPIHATLQASSAERGPGHARRTHERTQSHAPWPQAVRQAPLGPSTG